MNTDLIEVVALPVGAFIEIDDPTTGQRRLGLVCGSGTEFIDYIDHENPPTPLAILNTLSPVVWGDCNAIAANLMETADWTAYKAYSDLLIQLTDTAACNDTLTLNRAAKWAFDTGNRDLHSVVAAGVLETSKARCRQKIISTTATNWIETGAV